MLPVDSGVGVRHAVSLRLQQVLQLFLNKDSHELLGVSTPMAVHEMMFGVAGEGWWCEGKGWDQLPGRQLVYFGERCCLGLP